MKKIILVLTTLTSFFVLISYASAECQTQLISDCSSCQMRAVTVCTADAPPALEGNRGVRDFINGAKVFEQAMQEYGNGLHK